VTPFEITGKCQVGQQQNGVRIGVKREVMVSGENAWANKGIMSMMRRVSRENRYEIE